MLGQASTDCLDRFRLAEFQDAIGNKARLEPRVSRWSEASFDIRALRQMALDGPMAVDEDSQALLETSLSQAMVKPDDAGNVRLIKAGFNNTARDDVSAALVLACGATARRPKSSGVRSLGLVG